MYPDSMTVCVCVCVRAYGSSALHEVESLVLIRPQSLQGKKVGRNSKYTLAQTHHQALSTFITNLAKAQWDTDARHGPNLNQFETIAAMTEIFEK